MLLTGYAKPSSWTGMTSRLLSAPVFNCADLMYAALHSRPYGTLALMRSLTSAVLVFFTLAAGCGSPKPVEELNPPLVYPGPEGSTARAPSRPSDLSEESATVVRVVDGDTIRVVHGGVEKSVRIVGVDTPESVHPNKPDECLGNESSAFTKTMLPPGAVVRLVFDVERVDRFKRTLAYVHRDDGLDVGRALLEAGLAQDLVIRPNGARKVEYAAVEEGARRRRLGVWGPACAV